MGSNPMQKMKRNAILIGLIMGLMVGLVLCVIVYLFLTNSSNVGSTSGEDAVTVCMLNKNIKSGTKITEADIITKNISIENAPADATMQAINGVAKIDLSSGTILTTAMLNSSSVTLTDDLREQEYNMITLPSQLAVGDFIDIRLQLPTGGDYIVISKKKVQNCNADTIWLNMYEEEIELMSNAIVEYYIMKGSKLYATTYTEPGIQNAAVGTYVPNQTVSTLISSNPNIKNYINSERYAEALKSIRNTEINTAVSQYEDAALTNIEEKIKKEIQNLKETRETYFGTLNSVSY